MRPVPLPMSDRPRSDGALTYVIVAGTHSCGEDLDDAESIRAIRRANAAHRAKELLRWGRVLTLP
jgi:hypothetical protein